MSERLQKFLAQAGIGSRRGCENFIKEGRVTVNGNVAKLGTKVSNEDVVEFDNKAIELKEVDIKVIALNKPEGVLSSTAREKKIPIVDPRYKSVIIPKLINPAYPHCILAPIVITAEIRQKHNIDKAMFHDCKKPTKIIRPTIIE